MSRILESVKKEQTAIDITTPDIKMCYKSTVIRQTFLVQETNWIV